MGVMAGAHSSRLHAHRHAAQLDEDATAMISKSSPLISRRGGLDSGGASSALRGRSPHIRSSPGCRPAPVVERRRCEGGDPPVRADHHRPSPARASCRRRRASPPSTRTAPCGSSIRSTPRSMYCLDRVPAVTAQRPELRKRRAVQDGALRQPRRDRKAVDEGAGGDPRRHPHRHDGRRVQCRGEECGSRGPGIPAGTGPTPS